ncbi:xanthine dehydrogenase family protein molybdopterin-binding subunit [Actibacterium sp. 188UL27-1]|uniref:xanthine dehydrogenase family protein molybdopterin-binding subunit n=1 Tax=Actibacterium sp. 188UL27-1 TaxID=2786961 RepID=UPI0019570300|nr:molybdopterin cofactor-binding domain-containing protein [Actibacterium sp. 188UL27-1]MBM7068771.1 xanthine dehydrogenase family protein molybdopterin-binding subunit [Actibacterium sp. 188UL27-1]
MAVGKILRRGFLIGSAAIAGGVAFGTYRYLQPFENPLDPAAGETTLNPYILITAAGVSIITPRAEMGQGIHTTLAALVAEELDLDWQQVTAIHGPPAAAYLNASAMALGLPTAEYDDRSIRRVGKGAVRVAQKLAFGIQLTGGSTSTTDAFDRMRRAGAAARMVLTQAAGKRWGIDPILLKTEAGQVIDADGRSLSYTDLAADAAQIIPPADPPLREPANWRLLGQTLPRLDMVPKVTGTARYATDIDLPDLLCASVRATPFAGGTMIGLDTNNANTLPGVRQIVSLGNGVAVVADNTWIAMKALDQVDVTWSPPAYPATTEAQMARIESAFDTRADSTLRDDGLAEVVVEAARAESLSLVEARYTVPYLAHATMEPMTATALFKGDQLTIWCGTQVPTLARDTAAAHVGLDPDQVTIITTFMGGGFGRRSETDYTTQAAQIAVALPDVPIRMTWRREEDISHDFYRPAAIARLTGAVGPGRPEAIDMAVAAPSVLAGQSNRMVGFAPPLADKLLVEGAFDQPYALPNFRVSGHAADTGIPVGVWRSVGHSYNTFFLESFLDEMAHAGELDPVAMRLALLEPEHTPSARTLESVAAMANWGQQLPEGTAQGVGFCHCFGSSVAQVVQVSDVEGQISVDHVWCAVDVGQALDPGNIEGQMESGILFGLSAAMFGQITFADGVVEQSNFHDFDSLRMDRTPLITTRILQNNLRMGGVGEVGTPPVAAALANAIFALTGQRIRDLPLANAVSFT